MPSFLSAIGTILVTVLVQGSVASAAGQPVRVGGGRWLLAGRVYESAKLSPHPHLIIVIHGDARKLVELLALLDQFDLWFNLVTPRRAK